MSVPNETPAVSPVNSPVVGSEKPETVVSREAFDRLLDEKKKAQKQLDELKAERKAAEEADLQRKGELQKLLDLQKAEAEDLKKKLADVDAREKDRKKFGAVVSAIGSNVEDKWLALISSHIDEVVIDEATGKPDPLSVSKVADSLKKTWPEMLKATPVGMPNGAPAGTGPTTISRAEWKKLSAKEMAKWGMNQVID